MTEAQQLELLSRENAALRQRVEQLELALAQRAASSSTASARPAAVDASSVSPHYAHLFEQAPVIIFEMNAELQTRLWNHTCERLFGYSASEMLGKNPYTVLSRTIDPVESERSAAEMRAKGWTRSVLPATTKDGRQLVCAWISTYLTDADGQRVGIACYGRDLTEEQARERARREADLLFATTFETAGVGLCIMDERGHFLRVNSAYCQLYGWSSAELLGQHFASIWPAELRDRATQEYNRLVQGGSVGRLPSVELNLRRRDHSPLSVLASFSMITLEDGRRIQVSAVADVTERKAQAAELQQRMHEVQREAAEKTRLLAELDQKLEVIAGQHQQILALSAPVLDIWDGVLLLPLIGRLDGRRVSTITEVLLQAVVERRTRNVILDMTSLELLDTANIGYIGTMVQALRLLGVRSIITGIRPAAAQSMVHMGVDLHGVQTVRDLQQGLRACIDPALHRQHSR